ncbi:MAG: hypothetical protein EON58_18450, partial [Alphaproteobacteria bacterium]
MLFTYSERGVYEAKRDNAAATKSENAQVQTNCVYLGVPQDFADCVREEAKATHEKKHAEADLQAQQDVAAFGHGLLWFSALGFITSAGGLWALVWTFREQRRLTQHASRAVIVIKRVIISKSSPGYYWVRFELLNHGDTGAFDVQAVGQIKFAPGADESGEPFGKPASETFICQPNRHIAPKGDGEVRFRSEEESGIYRLPEHAGRRPYDGA